MGVIVHYLQVCITMETDGIIKCDVKGILVSTLELKLCSSTGKIIASCPKSKFVFQYTYAFVNDWGHSCEFVTGYGIELFPSA